MKKKFLLSAILICIGILAFGIINTSAETYGDLTYEVENGEITITGCSTSASGELVIPSEINGYAVTKIGHSAFINSSYLTGITIPKSVTYISDYALYGCIRLTHITVDENNMNYVSESGVLFNKNKTNLIKYPRGIQEKNYIIPDTVEYIVECAFYMCNLKKIVIPKNVRRIGTAAFDSVFYPIMYYQGTEEEWGNINILGDNELTTWQMIYNYTPIEKNAENTYLVSNEEEFYSVLLHSDGKIVLLNDIVVTKEFRASTFLFETFTGIFDGSGKKLTLNNAFCRNNKGKINNVIFEMQDAHCLDGAICGVNQGVIENCKVGGVVGTSNMVTTNTRTGAVVCSNGSGAIIRNCIATLYVDFANSMVNGYATGFVGNNSGIIENCYSLSVIKSVGASALHDKYIVGFVYENNGTIKNSYYAGEIIADTGRKHRKFPFIRYNNGMIENSYYDSSLFGGLGGYGEASNELKKLTSYKNWDFKNTWGVSDDINNGYPYLRWEYPNRSNNEITADICGVKATENGLKFISQIGMQGENEITTFGTAFIPLWLFETGATNTAIVQYDNSNYNIQNGQTFGANLSGIPESFKDMAIVGKSFVKDTNGNYIWSDAKYASVSNTTLKNVE